MDRRILAAGWVLLAALAACENFQKLREEYCATTGATTDACVRDTDPPLPPVLVAPASPANDNNPSVTGTAEAGSTIRLYASADCAGEVSGTGVVTPSGAFAVAVTVGDDTTTSFSATATDAAGNVSGCSASVTYVEDSTPPVVPALAGSVPMPPANDNNPSIFGTAEPGSTIRLYTDCAGAEAVSGSVDPDGSFSIVVSVGDNTTTTFFARAEDAAGNRSECSQGFVYVENSQLPVAPQLTGTSPASPANENNPSVAGTAEAGTTVRLYTTSNCSGAVAGMGNVDGAGAFSISVSVADNSSTTFYATATNTLSLTSACSTGLLYVEDSQPPVLTVSGTVPASPANSNNPSVTGMTEGAATVRVFTNNNCGGAAVGVAVAAASGEFFVPVSVGDNSSTSFYGQAEDAAGNRSSCTGPVTYAEDSIPPSATGASVSDGVAPAEIDYQQTVATVDAYWSGFTNGVAAYEYNLSTSTGCAGEAIATMNVGNVIAKSTSGLTL
ncbi:MAG: Ig-like domain-containing protein, partial [Myxococcota bacterium]